MQAFILPSAVTLRHPALPQSYAICAPSPTYILSPRMSSTPAAPSTTAPTLPSNASPDPSEEPPFALPEQFPSPPPLTTLGHSMTYTEKTFARRAAASLRMFLQLRGRVSKRTILTARLSGPISEKSTPPQVFGGDDALSLPTLINSIRLAAHDPRIEHLHLRIDLLSCGWGKIFEIRRHLDYFSSTGKSITVFMEQGGPKEYFLAMGFAVYVPPEGDLSLRGFASSGAFVRGVLDNIGISPQVVRYGKYKSAGDQLDRRDMAPAQREVITALLGDVHSLWSKSVSEATSIPMDAVADFVNRSPWDMREYVREGFVTGMCQESDLEDALKIRFAPKGRFESDDDVARRELPAVDIKRYARRTSEKLLGIAGNKRIAVIRAVGAITTGENGSSPITGSTLGSDSLVKLIRKVRDDKRYVACLLRCDSPGGSATASDIIWSELRKLAKKKPLIASQSDVAASGGYYLSMACEIVAEPLTITGSVGVVTVKPSLGELYKRIGYAKENISIGSKYAELLVDDREFTEEEMEYYREGALLAYKKFVSKAAVSRGKTFEEMDEVAQGRVWTGQQAKEKGMVDYIGGVWRALELLKEKAGIEDEFVKLEEIRTPLTLGQRLGLPLSTRVGSSSSLHAAVGKPIAMCEVDGSLSEVSPLTRLVSDAILAPLIGDMGVLAKQSQVLGQVLKTLRGN